MKIYYIRYSFYGQTKDVFISANNPKEAISCLSEEHSVPEHNIIAIYENVPRSKWETKFV